MARNLSPALGACSGEACRDLATWKDRVEAKSGLVAEGQFNVNETIGDIRDLCSSMGGCLAKQMLDDGYTDNGILRHVSDLVAVKGEA